VSAALAGVAGSAGVSTAGSESILDSVYRLSDVVPSSAGQAKFGPAVTPPATPATSAENGLVSIQHELRMAAEGVSIRFFDPKLCTPPSMQVQGHFIRSRPCLVLQISFEDI